MKKIVILKESDLVKIIKNLIEEQDISQKFQAGQKRGQVAGKQAKETIVKGANQLIQKGKEILITIGGYAITIIVLPFAVVWNIGGKIFKLGRLASDSLLKLLSSTGKVVVGTAKQITQSSINALKAAGIMIDKGYEFVKQQIGNLKDSAISVAKFAINKMKKFGTKIYASVLIGASKIQGLGQQLGSWLSSQWNTIAQKVGATWNNAKNWAANQINNIKDAVSGAVSSVKKGVSDLAGGIANKAGQAFGAIQGFLGEMLYRMLSFESNDTLSILSEARQYNYNPIIL
jgi:hypothetical protein